MSHSTTVVDEPAARLLWPRALQRRAPAHYEFADEHHRRIPLKLAGYPLEAGRRYRMRVRMQDGHVEGWRLQVTPPSWVAEWPSQDAVEGNARYVEFDTRGASHSGGWQYLKNPAAHIECRIIFDDGRPPFAFSVPIHMVKRWMSVPIILIGAISFGVGLIPLSLSRVMHFGIVVAALFALAVAIFAYDFLQAWGTARKMRAKLIESLPQPATVDPDVSGKAAAADA